MAGRPKRRRHTPTRRWQERLSAAATPIDRIAAAYDCLRSRMVTAEPSDIARVEPEITAALMRAAEEIQTGAVR